MSEIILNLILFALSLAVLLKASDWFIYGAERIGLSFGIAPFIIGVTIIAFGTSLPELATSIASVLDGKSEIVIGNIVGSNITNIALVIGVVAVIGKEIKIENDIMNIDMPKLLASALLLWFILQDLQVTLIEAIICLVGIIIFVLYTVSADRVIDKDLLPVATWKDYAFLIGGGVLVYFSAGYTIDFVSAFAIGVGLPLKIVGLSLVALGTSLPELIVSVQAARKGKTGIAIGNVLGSNVFNSFFVLAAPSFFGPLTIPPDTLTFSLPMMMALTLLFAFMCVTRRISRWEGLILLLIYVYFISELF
jgi:cation:H+ antiporter